MTLGFKLFHFNSSHQKSPDLSRMDYRVFGLWKQAVYKRQHKIFGKFGILWGQEYWNKINLSVLIKLFYLENQDII